MQLWLCSETKLCCAAIPSGLLATSPLIALTLRDWKVIHLNFFATFYSSPSLSPSLCIYFCFEFFFPLVSPLRFARFRSDLVALGGLELRGRARGVRQPLDVLCAPLLGSDLERVALWRGEGVV